MVKKLLLAVALIALVLVLSAASYVALMLPHARPAPDIRIERTTERVARGQYLTEHVFVCTACHAGRDWTRYGAPTTGDYDAGECWSQEQGFPGHVCAPNLTALSEWSDGEILRAIREGVSRDGHGLFPIMPYDIFKGLSDDDVHAVIAYLRTLPPGTSVPRAREIPFPALLATKFAPAPVAGPVAAPDPSDRVAYGRYLAMTANCHFCHTPVDESEIPIPGLDFSGGHVFPTPVGRVVTANITPDATGIGALTEENFISLFRAYEQVDEVAVPAPAGMTTIMPWFWYQGMSDEDLGAIYAYLRTVAPIDNTVDTWPDAGGD